MVQGASICVRAVWHITYVSWANCCKLALIYCCLCCFCKQSLYLSLIPSGLSIWYTSRVIIEFIGLYYSRLPSSQDIYVVLPRTSLTCVGLSCSIFTMIYRAQYMTAALNLLGNFTFSSVPLLFVFVWYNDDTICKHCTQSIEFWTRYKHEDSLTIGKVPAASLVV